MLKCVGDIRMHKTKDTKNLIKHLEKGGYKVSETGYIYEEVQ